MAAIRKNEENIRLIKDQCNYKIIKVKILVRKKKKEEIDYYQNGSNSSNNIVGSNLSKTIKLDKSNLVLDKSQSDSNFIKRAINDLKNSARGTNNNSSSDNSNKSLEQVERSGQEKLTLKFRKSKFSTQKSIKKVVITKNKFKLLSIAVFFFCLVKKITKDNNKVRRLKSIKKFNYHYDVEDSKAKIETWMYNCIKMPYISLLKDSNSTFDISVDDNSKDINSVTEDQNTKYIKIEVYKIIKYNKISLKYL